MRNLFYGLKLLRSCFHSKYLDTVQVARVLWVANGGPAQRSGIKVGDKVSPPTWIHLPQTPFPFGVSERATWGAKNFKAVGAADDLPFHFNLEIEGRKREREREREKIALFLTPGRESRLFPLKGSATLRVLVYWVRFMDYERLCNEHGQLIRS